jgi:hypothetical protein
VNVRNSHIPLFIALFDDDAMPRLFEEYAKEIAPKSLGVVPIIEAGLTLAAAREEQ